MPHASVLSARVLTFPIEVTGILRQVLAAILSFCLAAPAFPTSYDPNGNLATKTDFNGKTTTYAYDSMNQLLSKTPDASFHAVPVTYSYSHGLRSGMTDASGSTGYFYSAARLQQVFKPAGQINYNYDLGNNLTQLSGGGMSVNYTYDVLNRLSTVQENNTGTTSYGYDNVGNLQSVTYPNGVVHSYSYDTRNRLKNLGVENGA